MEVFQQPVIGLGEVLWDCFPDGRRPGGAPANVAYHVQQLGHPAQIASRVGEDALGAELREYLAERGLGVSLLQHDPDHPTGTVTVDTTDPSQPRYTIHESVAWDFLECTGELVSAARGAAAICFGTLAQRGPTSHSTVQQCLAAATDSLLVYDVNLRQDYYDRLLLEKSLQAAHVVKLNHEEMPVVAGALGLSTADNAAMARDLQARFEISVVCVTRAADGCALYGVDDQCELPGVPVTVVDAVGAGDAYTAALISGLLRGWSLRRTATLANQVGAWVAGQAGAMPKVNGAYQRLIEMASEAS